MAQGAKNGYFFSGKIYTKMASHGLDDLDMEKCRKNRHISIFAGVRVNDGKSLNH